MDTLTDVVKPSVVIERAITALDRRGWTAGSDGWANVTDDDGDSRVCLEGALQVGMGLDFIDIAGSPERAKMFTSHPAYVAVQEELGIAYDKELYSLWGWNDSICRSKAQAVAVLVAARDKLRQEGR